MTRSLPIIFGQTDYLQHLGTSPTATIASDGCYLTSFAMLARACGKITDPVELNKIFIQKQLYVNQDMMVDDNLTKVYPDIVYQDALLYRDIPADLNKLKEFMSDSSIWVVLEIDLGNNFTHFVLCAGVNGVVSIADPMTKSIIDFSSKYGDPAKAIIKMIIFKGSPAATADQQIIDDLRLARDNNWNSYQSEVKKNEELTGTINSLQGKVNEIQNENSNLTSQIKQVNESNANIAALYKAKCEEDATAVENGVKAEYLLKDVHETVLKLAASLGVKTDGLTDKQIVDACINAAIKLEETPQPKTQVAFQALLTFLLNKGLNEYLKSKKIDPIDINNYLTDPLLEKKLMTYLDDLLHELQVASAFVKVNNLNQPPTDTQGTSDTITPVNQAAMEAKKQSFLIALFKALFTGWVESSKSN